MNLSDKLLIVAEWLENSENDLLVDAENSENHLETVALALTKAASVLKEAAVVVDDTVVDSLITPESLDELAAVAEAFDESDDEFLKKQASVLDELFLTLAAPQNYIVNFKKTEDERISLLKKKYKEVKEFQDENNKVADSLNKIEKSDVYKRYRVLEQPMSARTCPVHFGQPMSHVAGTETSYQCSLDGKVYDYEVGFTTDKGTVPGTSVAEQSKTMQNMPEHAIFDSRNSRLGVDK